MLNRISYLLTKELISNKHIDKYKIALTNGGDRFTIKYNIKTSANNLTTKSKINKHRNKRENNDNRNKYNKDNSNKQSKINNLNMNYT